MSNNPKGASKDKNRLALTSERVKVLRVQTGVATGQLLNGLGSATTIVYTNNLFRCQ